MMGAALTASYWGQMKGFYDNGKLPCTRPDKALVEAGFVFTIMGYVTLGVGSVGACVGAFVFFKPRPAITHDNTPRNQGGGSHQQVSTGAEQEYELPVTASVVQGYVVSSSSSSSTDAGSCQGTALKGGSAQVLPSLTDKLRDLEVARTQGLLSDEDHASAKADLIQGFAMR